MRILEDKSDPKLVLTNCWHIFFVLFSRALLSIMFPENLFIRIINSAKIIACEQQTFLLRSSPLRDVSGDERGETSAIRRLPKLAQK